MPPSGSMLAKDPNDYSINIILSKTIALPMTPVFVIFAINATHCRDSALNIRLTGLRIRGRA